MKRSVLGAVLVGIVLGLTVPSTALAADDIVKNGTFFPPHIPDNGLREYAPNTTPGIDGWQVSDGNVDVYSHQLARNTYQAVDLNGGQPGTIQQLIQTTPGTTVTLHWQHTRNTHPVCQAVGNQGYTVTVLGVTLSNFVASGPIGYWQPETLKFQAQKSHYELSFNSTIEHSCGALITDVSGEATPS